MCYFVIVCSIDFFDNKGERRETQSHTKGKRNNHQVTNMKHLIVSFLVLILGMQLAHSQNPRTIIDLNGTWDFDQTTTAFPPAKFTRTIPVPGLIHLAEPKIVEYDKFFKRPDKVEAKEQFNLYNLDYTPRYSWYRKKIFIPKELEGKEGMITIKKSQYVTQVYVNGIDMGTSMACYTPVEFPINKAIKFGAGKRNPDQSRRKNMAAS